MAEGSGLLDEPADRIVIAGHGFGAIVAAWTAAAIGSRCAGLVLVDGGWESLEAGERHGCRRVPSRPRRAAGGHGLAGRLPRRPASVRSARAGTPTRSGRPGRRSSRRMPGTWSRRPGRTLARPAFARCSATNRQRPCRPSQLRSRRSSPRTTKPGSRSAALACASVARVGGRSRRRSVEVVIGRTGHNLMRYRPDEISAAILALAAPGVMSNR